MEAGTSSQPSLAGMDATSKRSISQEVDSPAERKRPKLAEQDDIALVKSAAARALGTVADESVLRKRVRESL